MNIGQLLRQKRKQKSLTQTDVAKAIGVSTNTISKYERNIIENIGREKIIALSKLLDIPTIVFIEAIDNIEKQDVKISNKEFYDQVKVLLSKTSLNDQEKASILSFLEFICKD